MVILVSISFLISKHESYRVGMIEIVACVYYHFLILKLQSAVFARTHPAFTLTLLAGNYERYAKKKVSRCTYYKYSGR